MAKLSVHIEAESPEDFYQTLEKLYSGASFEREPADEPEPAPEPHEAPKQRGRKAKVEPVKQEVEQAPADEPQFKSAPVADEDDDGGETLNTSANQPRPAPEVADVGDLPSDSKAFNGFITDIMGRMMETKGMTRPQAAQAIVKELEAASGGAKSADQLFLKKDPALVAAAYEALKALVA